MVESEMTAEDLKKMVRVTQFSPEYWKLVASLPAERKIWAAQSLPVAFNNAEVAYLVEPAAGL